MDIYHNFEAMRKA
jgi:hypothetical protein